MNKKEILIAKEIKRYYWNMANDSTEANELIQKLGIKSINVRRKWWILPFYIVSITLNRPGIMIGYKGKDAIKLEELFKQKLGRSIKVIYLPSLLDDILFTNIEY
jgi:ribosomal protein S3